MNHPSTIKGQGGLYVLGSLYPRVTGGMEIFNYYFLNHLLTENRRAIYFLGEEPTDNANGFFVYFKKRRPTRLFYPMQFFLKVYRLRKVLQYAYISYAEQSWILCYAQSLILRFFRIPYAVTIHWGKEPDWAFRYPFASYFRHAAAVIGVSEPICAAFKKEIPEQTFQYIPPLIPFRRATDSKKKLKNALGYAEDEKILLFLGSLKPMKNPDKIVEAFRLIGPEFLEQHRIRLLLGGRGEMEHEIRERVERYQLGRYIRLEGLIGREQVPDYYAAADAYIISSDYEGTSVSLLEAMFNELPIIASDAPGIHGMLSHEHNALLYETADTGRLAETIRRIFGEPSLAMRLAANARADFLSRYSYETMIAKYESVFSSLAKKTINEPNT